MSDFHLEVYKLTKALEENQYKPRDVSKLIPKCDILTREKLQKIPVDKSKAYSSTSGSTGEPVYVQKFYLQQLWYNATNIRELLWLKWDPSKTLAIVNAPVSKEESYPWITNPYMFGSNVGKCITHPLRGDIQGWLDKNKPEYLHSYPSVIKTLDTSKLLGVKSTGENGSTAYTSEELGTIAITCPDNPDVYHVMENIVLEIDDDKNIIATDLTHPYLKRYKIGDKGEFATCSCGRTLQTLNKNVIGRVRNMMKLPDGSSVWPLFGSNSIRNVCDTIKRFQCVQESYTDVTLKIQGIIPEDKYEEIKALVRNRLQHPFTVNIQVIDNFPDSKFEEFVCKINENPS